MKSIKKIAILFTSGLLALVTMGCGKDKTDNSIYFLSCKPEVANVWQEIAKVYEEETGVEVKVLTSSSGNHERTLKAEIAKRDAPTLFQINGQLEYGTWKNYCMDLKDTDLYSWLLDKDMAITNDGGVYGIPYVVEGYGIIYNNAIMEKYFALSSKATPYGSMEEVNTFDKLKAVVEDMTKHKSELGISGVFASTSFSPGDAWRWHTHVTNVPVFYEFKDKGINDTEVLDFTYQDGLKNIFDLYINNSCTPPESLDTKKVEDSMEEFALGKVAMVQNGNWAWTQIMEVSGNVVKEEDVKFMPIYIGAPGEENQGICIGTENFICVNTLASPEKQQAAIDFLEWLYSSEEGKRYVTEDLGFIPPFSTFSEAEYPKNPLAQEVMHYMNDPDLYSVNWVFAAYPSQHFKNMIADDLLLYCKKEMDWATVVDEIKTEWTTEKSAAE